MLNCAAAPALTPISLTQLTRVNCGFLPRVRARMRARTDPTRTGQSTTLHLRRSARAHDAQASSVSSGGAGGAWERQLFSSHILIVLRVHAAELSWLTTAGFCASLSIWSYM